VRTAVVTGASRGIGRAVARRLADAGLRVVTVSRSPAGHEHVAADLADPHAAAAAVLEKAPKTDVLVNNAAVLDGAERTFLVNQLAPFVLVRALRPERVVNVSSEAHRRARFDLTDPGGRGGRAGYADSKLAMILFTRELARRGTTAFAVHPGTVDTPLLRRYHAWLRRLFRRLTPVERAAEAVARLALEDGFGRFSGGYFDRFEPARPAGASDAAALVWWETLTRLSERA